MRRTLAVLLLAFFALCSSGCIYLRLLELKRQFAQFDRYFEADVRDGLKLTCKTPVLLDEDMAFFRLVPESRQRTGVAERWHFHWIKAGLPPTADPRDHELTADFIYVEHKLTRVILPERFFAFFPKPLFLALLRSLGHAEIDRKKRTAHSTLNEKIDSPDAAPPFTASDLKNMLGAPLEMLPVETRSQWHYRYQAASPDQRSGRIDIVFTVDGPTQHVRRIKGTVFDSTVDVSLER